VLPQAVSDHYRAQQRRVVATLGLVRREWAQMGDDLDASWARVGPRIALLTASAQLGAAREGASYVGPALAQQDIRSTPDGTVSPSAFVGVASSLDGLTYGSLDDLLYGAVIHARTAPADTLAQRLQVGGKWLDGLVHTQVADAGRMAASTAITARPRIGWVRMVNPPCCQRCAVLAGRVYSHSHGFQRHPRCDCQMLPTTVANPDAPGITIGPDDVKDLTVAQRQAIADGADMNRVINSHRAGKRSGDLMTTREAAPRGGRRLTPEGIYRVSATREEALRRLRDNGYLL
jgi:hypothetical protein